MGLPEGPIDASAGDVLGRLQDVFRPWPNCAIARLSLSSRARPGLGGNCVLLDVSSRHVEPGWARCCQDASVSLEGRGTTVGVEESMLWPVYLRASEVFRPLGEPSPSARHRAKRHLSTLFFFTGVPATALASHKHLLLPPYLPRYLTVR